MLEHLPLILFLAVFVLIFLLRMPIPTGMIAACLTYFVTDALLKGVPVGAMFLGEGGSLHLVAQKTIEQVFTNNTLIAVPLFIFAANIMNAGKITEYVFGVCKGLVGRFRGGLAHVNVLASLVFSGMTGSAVADASGLGKMEIDAMRAEGYDAGFSCAITAASATIGPIFPPSIPMVIYSMLTGASVGALFMAGMVPGVLLAVALCIYVAIIAGKRKYPKDPPPKLSPYLRYLVRALPAMLTPVILLIGIYTGVMTPTEAGAIAGLYALLVASLGYRVLKWEGLKQVLIDTVKSTGSVSIMVGAASAISFIFAKEQIGTILGNWLLTVTGNKYIFLLLVNLIILVLGMFVDTSVIQLVMIPILWPVAQALDINVIHFGLVIVFNMMVGLSTPPFGMCLFITSGISGTPLKDIVKEIWWPIVVMLIVLFIITFIPEVVLFLPKTFGMM
ncbi:TRAP transporter large permease [Candidatus Pseudoscillospira sp. SGI.172]|uniref:TRAP transporter large permease n=1 Tax=Candidatus Pseudoscillospira sp. SGI.172 TaxID=3420582 RepID=UPI00117AAF9A|nr:TRAP transporter large permease [Pseudoflavonifractor sp.]MDY3020334.1 TRAP transporter large permease [Oscillospiraceae bacterium]